MKFVDNKDSDVDEWNALDTFFKKYNKVLVDQLSIEREKNRLVAENRELQV